MNLEIHDLRRAISTRAARKSVNGSMSPTLAFSSAAMGYMVIYFLKLIRIGEVLRLVYRFERCLVFHAQISLIS